MVTLRNHKNGLVVFEGRYPSFFSEILGLPADAGPEITESVQWNLWQGRRRKGARLMTL